MKCREILLTPLENTEPSAEQKQSDHLSPPRRGRGQLAGNSEPCRQAELWCDCQGDNGSHFLGIRGQRSYFYHKLDPGHPLLPPGTKRGMYFLALDANDQWRVCHTSPDDMSLCYKTKRCQF